MTTKQDFLPCVARGAALLDKEMPGWASCIDQGALNLGSCVHCVLGQLYDGGYFNAIYLLHGEPLTHMSQWTTLYGFNVKREALTEHLASFQEGVPLPSPYRQLQEAWMEVITQRLAPEPVCELVLV